MRKATCGGWLAFAVVFVLAGWPCVAPATNWSRTFDLEDEDDKAVAVTTDAEGFIYVLATCGKDSANDYADVVVLRYDRNGGSRRTWTYNSGGTDSAIAFVVDDQDVNSVVYGAKRSLPPSSTATSALIVSRRTGGSKANLDGNCG
jgi:hypothetical protein